MKKLISLFSKARSYFEKNGDLTEVANLVSNDTKFNNVKKQFKDSYPNMPESLVWDENQKNKQYNNIEFGSKAWIARHFNNAHLGIKAADKLVKANKIRFPLFMLLMIAVGYLSGLSYTYVSAELADYANYINGLLGFTAIAVTLYMAAIASGHARSIFSLFMMPKNILSEQQIEDVDNLILRTVVRDSKSKNPDLDDKFRNLVIDADGNPVDGQLLAMDLTEPVLFKAIRFQNTNYAISTVMALGTGLFMALPTLFSAVGYVSAVVFAITAIVELFITPPLKRRQAAAEIQASNSIIATLIDRVGVKFFQAQEEAKDKQVENANRDNTPYINIGESKGVLHDRRDPFAPADAGMPFGLTMNDLSTHLIALGATGTGKTSAVIRPIVRQWQDNKCGGMLVLDGKGTLPKELSGDNYYVINPQKDAFNPIENLDPDTIADVFYEIFKSNDGDSFWDDAARSLILGSTMCLYLSDTEAFTLENLYKAVVDDEFADQVLGSIEHRDNMTGHQARQVDYRLKTYSEMPDKQKQSVLNNALNWIGSTMSEKLALWSEVEHGIQVEDICQGKQIGICLPEAEFGKAGIVISNFAKKRAYRAVKLRGDQWPEGDVPVLLVIDEVQNLLTKAEDGILSIARSLGLYALFATQNIDGIIEKFKDVNTALKLMGNLKSMISLDPLTEVSYKFVAGRMGNTWKVITESGTGTDTLTSANSIVRNPVARFSSGNIELSDNAGKSVFKSATKGIYEATWGNLKSIKDEDKQQQNTVSIRNVNNIDETEVSGILSVPFTACAAIYRGGVPRRDVIKLTPEFPTKNNEEDNKETK